MTNHKPDCDCYDCLDNASHMEDMTEGWGQGHAVKYNPAIHSQYRKINSNHLDPLGLKTPIYFRAAKMISIYAKPDGNTLRTTKSGEYLGPASEYAKSDKTGNIWYHLDYGGWISNAKGNWNIIAKPDTSHLPPVSTQDKIGMAVSVAETASPGFGAVVETGKGAVDVIEFFGKYWKLILIGVVILIVGLVILKVKS